MEGKRKEHTEGGGRGERQEVEGRGEGGRRGLLGLFNGKGEVRS